MQPVFHVINSWHYLTDIHLVLECLALLDRYSPGTNLKQSAKKKAFERSEMGILRLEERGNLHPSKRLITQKISESQSVDLTNKDMGNHCLRDVHHAFTLHHAQEDRIFDIHDQLEM